jgi:lysophospholipase L1-like esterase
MRGAGKEHCGLVHLILLLVAVVGLAGCGSNGGAPSTSTSTSTPSTSTPSTSTQSTSPVLRLVVIGDSIPYNSPDDCPGCTGFVDRYAKAVQTATGRSVQVANLSQHTGLTLPGLLDELDQFRDQLATADVIVVGIAHNSNELSAEEPCGKPLLFGLPDWSAMDRQCATRSAQKFAPLYDKLYARVAAWRQGKPTILRTINRYNDVIGAPIAQLTRAQERLTAVFVGTWNTMLCTSAKAHGFVCADIAKAFNGPDGLRPSGDLLALDYTHPSDKGNKVIARVLADLGYAPLA